MKKLSNNNLPMDSEYKKYREKYREKYRFVFIEGRINIITYICCGHDSNQFYE